MANFSVGVSGHGVASRLHLPVLSTLDYIHAVRIQLPRIGETSYRTSQPIGGSKIPERIDLLIIGTPPFAHEYHARMAIDSGIPVLCEKPCGLSSEGALRIAACSSRTGTPVAVNYQLRFDDAVLSFRERLAAFRPRMLHIHYESNARQQASAMPSWYLDERLGGGVKFSILCHIIDLIHFLGYSFDLVSANRKDDDTTELRMSSNFPLDEIEVSASLSKAVEARITIETRSDHSRFVVMATSDEGAVALDLISGLTISERPVIEIETIHGPSLLSSSAARPWRSSLERLMRHVTNNGARRGLNMQGCATLQEATRVHEIIEAVGESWKLGRKVRVAHRP